MLNHASPLHLNRVEFSPVAHVTPAPVQATPAVALPGVQGAVPAARFGLTDKPAPSQASVTTTSSRDTLPWSAVSQGGGGGGQDSDRDYVASRAANGARPPVKLAARRASNAVNTAANTAAALPWSGIGEATSSEESEQAARRLDQKRAIDHALDQAAKQSLKQGAKQGHPEAAQHKQPIARKSDPRTAGDAQAEPLPQLSDEVSLVQHLIKKPAALQTVLQAIANKALPPTLSAGDALQAVSEFLAITDQDLTQVIEDRARPADVRRLLVLASLHCEHEGEPLRALYAIEDRLHQPGMAFELLVKAMVQNHPDCDPEAEATRLDDFVERCGTDLIKDDQLAGEPALALRLLRDLSTFCAARRETLVLNDLFDDQAGIIAIEDIFFESEIFSAPYAAALGMLAAETVRDAEAGMRRQDASLPAAAQPRSGLAANRPPVTIALTHLLPALFHLGPGSTSKALSRMAHFTFGEIEKQGDAPGAIPKGSIDPRYVPFLTRLRHTPTDGSGFTPQERGHLLGCLLNRLPAKQGAVALAAITLGKDPAQVDQIKAGAQQVMTRDLDLLIGLHARAGMAKRDTKASQTPEKG